MDSKEDAKNQMMTEEKRVELTREKIKELHEFSSNFMIEHGKDNMKDSGLIILNASISNCINMLACAYNCDRDKAKHELIMMIVEGIQRDPIYTDPSKNEQT